jgi:adenosylcobyric acid synthase
VLGVVPLLPELGLPEEDTVALERRSPATWRPGRVRIAVVRLPAIANFTDLAPLEAEADVRYAESAAALGGADLVVLPGSKDTLADLAVLKTRGFAAAIGHHVARGGAVLGICGGYQMLGARVEDPDRLESGGAARGLGLLPVRTRLRAPKITRRVRARWLPAGPVFEGYELHAGDTAAGRGARPLLESGGHPVGWADRSGRVWGVYVHGLFESGASRRHVLGWVAAGVAAGSTGDDRERRERAYDRLADALEAALGSRVFARLLRD